MNEKPVIYANALDAKVAARNLVHSIAKTHWHGLINSILGFVGKKVQNASGSLSAKFDASLLKSQNPEFQLWYSHRYGALRANFKVCTFQAGPAGSDYQRAHYAEVTIPLGEIDNAGVLTHVAVPYPLRTDYNADNVRQLRKCLRAAKDAYDTARDAVSPFGEHDN